jgi:TPP-dependent pyruvate/acetoin dehydrogenase alpha subunit
VATLFAAGKIPYFCVLSNNDMHFDKKELSAADLLHFYKSLLLPRMIEEKMLVLLRQGKISNGSAVLARKLFLLVQRWRWIKMNG